MQMTEPATPVRSARLKLTLMFLLPALMLVLATVVFFTGIGLPRGTTNKGVLVQPARQIDELPLQTPDGTSWRYADAPRGWGVLVPGAASCDETCRERVLLTRQVRLALGRDTERLQRYYLATGGMLDSATAAFLSVEHADLHVLQADPGALHALLGRPGEPDPIDSRALYLVDPRGFVMMHYLPTHSDRAMLDDLRFLLKNSSG